MPFVPDTVRKNEMSSLVQAAEAVALALSESACVQISTIALLIAKRIGRTQPDATVRLGEEGFARLVHEIKIWVSQLPSTCIAKIYKANVWPHRCLSLNEEAAHASLDLHVPGTPTGAESQAWAIYQVLCELGELLTRFGFNTHDIGGLYDHEKTPHLGILLRFPWSNEMRALFGAYGEDLKALRAIKSEMSKTDIATLQQQATSMWDTV